MADQFAWYMAALKGQRGDFDTKNPPSGYYRDRDRSLALWRDDAGNPQWEMTGRFQPKRFDQLCESMGTFIVMPVTYEAWEAHGATGRWPEDPTSEIEAARAERPGLGHNNPPPEMVILDELRVICSAFDTWFAGVGGEIVTEEQDAKVKQFTDRVAALKKQAIESHKTEKKYWLDGGREVDRRWDAAKDQTDVEQRDMAATATAYRIERKRKADEIDRLAREAASKAKAEAAAANKPIPITQPIRKPASGLRQVKVVVIDDLPALAAQLATLNAPEFREVCMTLARRLLDNKVEVVGAHLELSMRAA